MDALADRSWTERRGPRAVQIGLTTFGILALELALIRWASGQVRILAYFNNLILIACFLGMGLGLAAGRRRPGLVHVTLPALALLAVPFAFAEPLHLVSLSFPDPAVYLWGAETTAGSVGAFLRSYAIILALFGGIVAVFVCAGAALGVLFALREDLSAYSADLVGSLLGIVAITVATALHATPPVWLALGAAPFLWLSRRAVGAIAFVAVIALGQLSVKGAVFSPYNRIDLEHTEVGLTLSVNRDFHQYMHDLSDTAVAKEKAAGGPENAKRTLRWLYDLPWVLGDGRDRGLVIGAGTGNDVQAALRNGFREVSSVDIDGRIIALGRELHPERPYDDPRARPIVNDGRAWLAQHPDEKFDVVAFGFVDSHAMFSALSSLRLDNFLYTEEGLRSAWQHVAPGGHMTIALSLVGGPWLADRLYWTIAAATGQTPIMAYHRIHGGATFIVARDPARLHLDRLGKVPLIAPRNRPESIATTSDDWPFLYVRPDVFPWGYLMVLGAILALAFGAVLGRREARADFDWTLFLMGAGFLLLETRGVTALSVLCGSTWIVNAAVFSGVLLVALAANTFVQRSAPRRVEPWFACLFAAVLLVWAVPPSALMGLPIVPRAVLGGLLNALPVGFAGVIVSFLLSRARSLGAALGSNLVGSVVGGCLEYLSMALGLRALAVIALALYLTALLARLRRRGAAA